MLHSFSSFDSLRKRIKDESKRLLRLRVRYLSIGFQLLVDSGYHMSKERILSRPSLDNTRHNTYSSQKEVGPGFSLRLSEPEARKLSRPSTGVSH